MKVENLEIKCDESIDGMLNSFKLSDLKKNKLF